MAGDPYGRGILSRLQTMSSVYQMVVLRLFSEVSKVFILTAGSGFDGELTYVRCTCFKWKVVAFGEVNRDV